MRIEQHGGPGVDDVEGFDYMLLLALRIGRPTSDIFEIDLPSGHRRWTLQRLMDRLSTLGNALMGFENTVKGFARGDRHLEELQGGIPFERVLDCLLTGHPAQAFRVLIANGEHLLNDQGMGFDRRLLACPPVAWQDLLYWQA